MYSANHYIALSGEYNKDTEGTETKICLEALGVLGAIFSDPCDLPIKSPELWRLGARRRLKADGGLMY